MCNDATIDAIVTVQDGTTYTFKGKEKIYNTINVDAKVTVHDGTNYSLKGR